MRVAEPGEPYVRFLHLKFCPDPESGFAILRRGEELATDTVLRTDAEYVP